MNQETANVPFRATSDYLQAAERAAAERARMRHRVAPINAGHRAPLVLPVRRFGMEG